MLFRAEGLAIGSLPAVDQTASELAFHRNRVSRGITAADAHEREAAYRQALQELLAKLRVGQR